MPYVGLDITDKEAVMKTITEIKPDAVIHCAAWTAVDMAEDDVEYDADDCIVRREITAAGKSRAFVNDTPVPLSVLKELGEQLIDVHSQHQNLLLGKQDFQMEIVDIIADDKDLLDNYRKAYGDYREKQRQLDDLQERLTSNKANADFLLFQYEELDRANLVEGEQETLEAQANQMSHYEDIKTAPISSQIKPSIFFISDPIDKDFTDYKYHRVHLYLDYNAEEKRSRLLFIHSTFRSFLLFRLFSVPSLRENSLAVK